MSANVASTHEKTKQLLTSLRHREFRDDRFWQEIPAWKQVSAEQFADHNWQTKNAIRKISHVKKALEGRIGDELLADMEKGQHIAPMNIRITPYIFSLIDWDNPIEDPLRKQFLPIGSQFLPDHPFFKVDSLHEDEDSPVPTLTHRYPDKVLFLPLTTCPVYCSYCTRSRVIGGSTELMDKASYGANPSKWEAVFHYIKTTSTIEDVVISGGDIFNLTAEQVKVIGESLLAIPHIRRIRYATKGIAVLPQKILTDDNWFNALVGVRKLAKSLGKQVVVHTHFSSPHEMTKWSKLATDRLFAEDFVIRNQAVLQSGVNDIPEIMVPMTRQLSYLNIQPYYVYVADMVQGCEHLRTTLGEGRELEKIVRGTTAGFNTPTFVCDLPGGGGKRHVASYEYYDKENGISVWRAPFVKPDAVFTYFDPIHRLSTDAQKRWADPTLRQWMVDEAIKKA